METKKKYSNTWIRKKEWEKYRVEKEKKELNKLGSEFKCQDEFLKSILK